MLNHQQHSLITDSPANYKKSILLFGFNPGKIQVSTAPQYLPDDTYVNMVNMLVSALPLKGFEFLLSLPMLILFLFFKCGLMQCISGNILHSESPHQTDICLCGIVAIDLYLPCIF